MTPERWKQVEALYHAAHARPLADRASFLSEACPDDESLRREVESLLDESESGDRFLAQPALGMSASTATDFVPPIMAGRALGVYQVQQLIGAGGMGEVYRAHDTKLGRDVAIKILPRAFTSSPDRLARFEREARMLASLNHPNICAIYGLEEAGDIRFLILELVEGDTLADTLAQVSKDEGLSVHRALAIARQLADALVAAHKKGIVHRDLKPANIKITPSGVVKVLDFGLAKAIDVDGSALEHGGRRQGAIVGTPAYMSPEQARGLPVDRRTDIWAFGCVLYQMLTGRVTFAGETVSDSMAKILTCEPDWSVLPTATPASIRQLLLHSLSKDLNRRLRDIQDVVLEIDKLKPQLDRDASLVEHDGRADPPAPADSRRWWIAAAIASLVVAGVTLDYRRQPAPARMMPSLTFTKLTSQAGIEQHPSLSPDGKWIVYSAPAAGGQHIFLQNVGRQNPIDLSNDDSLNDTQPVFSPDGEQIAFRSERQGGGIFVMGRTGELRRKVASAGFNPAWSPDGLEIMYSTEIMTTNPYNKSGIGELWAITVAGGLRRHVYKGDAVQPAWSPNGHRIAFWTVADDGQRDLFTIPTGGGEPRAVTNDRAVDFSPVWAPDGKHLLFSSDRAGSPNLWRVAIDETTGEVQGALEPLTTNSSWVADLTLSGDGDRVAFASMTMTSNIQRFEFDPVAGSITGAGTWVTSGSAFRRYLDVSPDNHRLVFSSGIGQEDLFLIDADGSKMRQLTNDAALDRRPTWSPDGRQIAFESTRGGPYQIWAVNGDGTNVRQLTDDPTYRFNYHAWSPAGDRMFTTSTATWNSLIFDPRRPWSDQQPQRLPLPSFRQFSSMSWSPDGRRLAGWSPEGIATYDLDSQSYEVHTDDRAIFPQWIDSNRLVYPRGSTLMILDLTTRQSREILSTAPDVIRNIAVSRDGRQIFITRGADEADIWMAQLK